MKLQNAALKLDLIGLEDERRASGAALTLLAVVGCIAYIVFLVHNVANTPPETDTTTMWSAYHGADEDVGSEDHTPRTSGHAWTASAVPTDACPGSQWAASRRFPSSSSASTRPVASLRRTTRGRARTRKSAWPRSPQPQRLRSRTAAWQFLPARSWAHGCATRTFPTMASSCCTAARMAPLAPE
eukprot:7376026-Prymnesium_polylepis.2